MKIELNMSVLDAVRLHDVLMLAMDRCADASESACDVLRFTVQMVSKALEAIETPPLVRPLRSDGLSKPEQFLLAAKQKTLAVKSVLDRFTGLGLKEAIDFVDQHAPCGSTGTCPVHEEAS